jgi:hypothetical protein
MLKILPEPPTVRPQSGALEEVTPVEGCVGCSNSAKLPPCSAESGRNNEADEHREQNNPNRNGISHFASDLSDQYLHFA